MGEETRDVGENTVLGARRDEERMKGKRVAQRPGLL